MYSEDSQRGRARGPARTPRFAAWILAALWTACGSGQSSGDLSGGDPGQDASLTARLHLLSTEPVEGSATFAPDAALTFQFDGTVVPECLEDTTTGLFRADRKGQPILARVEGEFTRESQGQTVRFNPATALQRQTDYVFRFAALTCDPTGRILDEQVDVRFSTRDDMAPLVLASVPAHEALNVDRSGTLEVTFSEALDPDSLTSQSVQLFDAFGTDEPMDLALVDNKLLVKPRATLPGDRAFVLRILAGNNGLRDAAGLSLEADLVVGFRTATDDVAPLSINTWPPTNAVGSSPICGVSVLFDEPIDPFSLEPSSVSLTDQDGNIVPFTAAPSPDLATLHFMPDQPLLQGRQYTLSLRDHAGALADRSGHALAAPRDVRFLVGNDSSAPALLTAEPLDGALRIPTTVRPQLWFSEALHPDALSQDRVLLKDHGGQCIPILAELEANGFEIQITPQDLLIAGSRYTLTVRGGPSGVFDRAGNTMTDDVSLTFVAGDGDALEIPWVHPTPGATVPLGSRPVAIFGAPLRPETVNADTVRVLDGLGQPVPGTPTLTRGGRVVTFTPTSDWDSSTTYRFHVQGGSRGVLDLGGGGLNDAVDHDFQTLGAVDVVSPIVELALNTAQVARQANQHVPPSGFSLDAVVKDRSGEAVDFSTAEFEFTGPSPSPDAAATFAEIKFEGDNARMRLPQAVALTPGDWQVKLRVADTSGNIGESTTLSFAVIAPSSASIPFERTQVVWARFDLDRDSNGTPDFRDDLIRLGLLAAGDPGGFNDQLEAVLRAGVLAQAHGLFGRSADGTPVDRQSSALRFTDREPLGLGHTQIAVGGLDPEGPLDRVVGDASTGVLGRAYFDRNNTATNERNTSTRPGLGVFPAELVLYQFGLQSQIGSGFRTRFARTFERLMPALGGTPAGLHEHDPVVLDPDFDWNLATPLERARWQDIYQAGDEWATVLGVVLAHEIGHSVGLVAPGESPDGLHGDDSLHNQFSIAGDVMSTAIGYDTVQSLDYVFRDLNAAYLNHRLVLR